MDCVILDLDGTLANCKHRLHFIEGPKKNWDSFFDNCLDDSVIQPMFHLMNILSKDYKIVFITARPEKNRELTTKWLVKHNIEFSELLMRKNVDYNKSPKVKEKLVEQLRGMGYNPIYSFDDRIDCVAMFQSIGIYAFLVGENEEQILY